MARKKTKNDFESSLSELEDILNSMGEGGLSLEESLKKFETGVKLTRHCQTLLEQAEQKIQTLGEEE